ncbi:MAG: UvrD-helicase domain-containing protein, partial [Planctomycetota bacterium]
MDRLTDGLNEAQADAVRTLSGPLLVLAGAGTGKTRVVTFRIANLIRHGTPPDRILAVTFTNKAAGEMRERVGELLGLSKHRRRKGEPEPPSPTVATFHAHCVNILRRHAQVIGYPAKFSIYDRGDQESLARSVLRELRLPNSALSPNDMLFLVSGWKNATLTPIQAANEAATDKEHLAAAAYRRYQDGLVMRGAMDFDDLLLQTDRLFRESPEVRAKEAGRFDHVLIDEYQDTNQTQYQITKHLAGSHRNLCVVGDDDQSIYAWRGADVTHILNFSNDWDDAKVICLESNYRSTAEILTMANRLIAFNTIRHDKSLLPSRPTGKRPRIEQYKDETIEAAKVVGEIHKLIHGRHVQPGDIAILFRTNEQPRLFETELRRADIPYVIMGAQSFYDRREVRDLVAYLKWIEQPSDEVSLRRIINTPARGLGGKAVETLLKMAVDKGVPLWTVISDDSATATLGHAAKRGVDDLRSVIESVRMRIETEGLQAGYQTLIERTAFGTEVAARYDKPEERESRLAALGEVGNAVAAYEDKSTKPTLTGFLSDIALSGKEMGSEKDRMALANSVWLLTMHAAKGLEFP